MGINFSEGEFGAGVAFLVKKWIDCSEPSLKTSDEQVESLRVKIKGQVNK